jgi:protein ImuB
LRKAQAINGVSPETLPRVVIAKERGALRIVAADEHALALGLATGMSLADARAHVPGIEAVPHDSEADARLLQALVDDFDRFTPMVAMDEPHGLVLDITGCEHLFGGERGLADAVRSRAGRYGLQARLAIARTPQGARALARRTV